MNKKLFLKLGLLVLSLSLVSCGQKNNSTGEDNSAESSSNQFVSSDQSSEKESIKIISPSFDNSVESKQVNEDLEKNTPKEDNSPESSANQFVSSDQSSVKESVKIISPPVENVVESKQGDEDVQKNTQQDIQTDTQQEETEKEYYELIKEAWQKQRDYIDSIDDPKVKQSVQTSHSAAIMESTGLLMEHPEDAEDINADLNRVLNGK